MVAPATSYQIKANKFDMTVNEAMLKVAQSTAQLYGYIEVDAGSKINALKDSFWGNRFIGAEAHLKGKKCEIDTCLYIIPILDDEKKEYERGPRIHIDMHFGKPRLSVSLPDKTFACLTYDTGKCSEAQAFGSKGLDLAISLKSQIDQLISK